MIINGECVATMAAMEPESIDAIVTDPPYELGFMGKSWDSAGVAFDPDTWRACLRVLKPGGHLLAFGGTRTFHRITCAIEDAGFEIRDCLSWLYGSGFPKSLDVSKAIDKAARRDYVRIAIQLGMSIPGNSLHDWTKAEHSPGDKWWEAFKSYLSIEQWRAIEREIVCSANRLRANSIVDIAPHSSGDYDITAPATDAAKQWAGWGTALKPAYEIIIKAQKPRTFDGERDIIVANLARLEAQLWSLLPANIAVENFKSSPSEYDAACAFAQWTADEQRNTLDGLFDQTDTSQFVLVMNTCLSIVTSWSAILGDLCELTSTCTTETASSLTTDLKTLKSSLSGLTPRIIIQAVMQADGLSLDALPAARSFRAVDMKWSATRELSALGNAIEWARTAHPDAADHRPAWEPIVLARKPFAGTVAANVQAYGTGALNVDGCRIGTDEELRRPFGTPSDHVRQLANPPRGELNPASPLGRWPANLVLDEDAAAMLDEQSGHLPAGGFPRVRNTSGYSGGLEQGATPHGVICMDSGGASRFFYVAKASRKERNAGLDGFGERPLNWSSGTQNPGAFQSENTNRNARNFHPTVKPIELMRWLCRIVTPPGGTILDPFAGSGTTGCAAALEGFEFIGIERETEYCQIARRRIAHWAAQRQPEQIALVMD